MTRRRLNKVPAASAPLRAVHAVRPAPLDSAKVAQVCALCRELSILPPRPISISDAQLIEVLLTPSPTRFQLLCNTFGTVCLELKGELEELKPLSKSTLEETKYLHILEFIHDVGIFDNGEEADLAKIKGDASDDDHLCFWLSILKWAKMMEGYEGTDVEPKFNTETFLQEMESFTEQMRVLSTLQLPDASSLVIGPLAEHLEEQKKTDDFQTYSFNILKKLETRIDSEMKGFQDCLYEKREEEEDSLLAPEEPPECIVDDEALTKIKLLQGNVKDLVNTFAMKYDLSLKNTVEGACPATEPRGELEDLLEKALDEGESLHGFVRNVGAVLDRLQSLRESQSNPSPVIRDLVNDNAEALELNFELVLPVAGRGRDDSAVYKGVFDDFF